MFVYNVNLNGKNIIKISFIIISIIIIIFFGISTYKIIKGSFKVKDQVNSSDISYIESKNYTNILKSVHDNLDEYIGKKICFSGYIYRLPDFEESKFVLARDMIINSNIETLIVGFLCDSNDINNFENNSWVEITGEIAKGNYNGDIPLIKVISIKQIEKPSDEYVYPPDSSYVPTSAMF